jgi:sugar phosphate isomerase/epimerase
MVDVSLSTMWSQGRFEDDMSGFVRAVRRLGFERIEVSYTVEERGLNEILKADQVAIPSVHSPVPKTKAPNGKWLNNLNLASLDEEERRLAVRGALTTIDWAARVGACCVVIHLGGVGSEMLSPERELRRLFDSVPEDWSAQAEALQRECHRLRAEGAPAYLAQAKASLREMAGHAAKAGVALGLENRYHFHEIPSVDEAHELLRDFPPDVVGFWYDVGHAEVLGRLGLVDKYRWLNELADRCLGAHLHDVEGIGDHRAPGFGTVDWDHVAQRLPAGTLRVFEIDQRQPEDRITGAVPFLQARGVL